MASARKDSHLGRGSSRSLAHAILLDLLLNSKKGGGLAYPLFSGPGVTHSRENWGAGEDLSSDGFGLNSVVRYFFTSEDQEKSTQD